jgi:thiamine-phosphate pyrophosphorylase
MNQTSQLDPRLYLILGERDCGERSPAEIVTAAAKGGMTLLQLREKTASTGAFLQLSRELQTVLDPYRIPLLINDRIDIALAAGTAGVHIGQDDMPVTDARRLLGPDAIIGLTVRSLDEAAAAPLHLVDYISIGGVFQTTSKDNPNPPIGVDGFTEIAAYLRRRTAMPLTAIAGINTGNAADVIRAGADGVAIISAICAGADPQQASRELRTLIDDTLAERKSE